MAGSGFLRECKPSRVAVAEGWDGRRRDAVAATEQGGSVVGHCPPLLPTNRGVSLLHRKNNK
eukprot:3940957-Rhodomonas_salina.5